MEPRGGLASATSLSLAASHAVAQMACGVEQPIFSSQPVISPLPVLLEVILRCSSCLQALQLTSLQSALHFCFHHFLSLIRKSNTSTSFVSFRGTLTLASYLLVTLTYSLLLLHLTTHHFREKSLPTRSLVSCAIHTIGSQGSGEGRLALGFFVMMKGRVRSG